MPTTTPSHHPSAQTLNAITAAAIAAILAGWWFFGLAPIQSQRAEARELTLALNRATDERIAAENTLAELRVRLQDTTSALDAQSVTLRKPEALNTLLADLAVVAAEHNVRLDAVTPSRTVTKDRYRLTPIAIRAVASYEDTRDWLAAIHGAFPDVTLVALSLTRTQDATAEARIAIVWFSAPPLATPPASNPSATNPGAPASPAQPG